MLSVRHAVTKFIFATSKKRRILGFKIAVGCDKEYRSDSFLRIEQALCLIRKYDPKTFRYLEANVGKILVCGDSLAGGYWHKALRTIEINSGYVCYENASVEQIACTLVHEGAHARLDRLGFCYEEPKRLQIERICFRAQRNFARRLPDSEDLVERYQGSMSYFNASHFSTAARAKASLDALRDLGFPEWIVKILEWKVRRNAIQRAKRTLKK